jgi:two-component system phosphate regulon sensor histidine kinase PhoR
MRQKKRLIWQIFPSYLIILLASLLILGWYASRALKALYLEHTAVKLEARVILMEKLLDGKLSPPMDRETDALCKDAGKKIGTRFTVILPSGRVIGDTEEDPANMDNHADRPEIMAAMAGNVGQSTRYSYTVEKRMMYVALAVRKADSVVAVLRASLPVTEIDKKLKAVYANIALAGILIAVAAAVVSLLVARRINKPLDEIKKGAGKFASGELQYRLRIPDSEEFGALADAMNRMAFQLDERIQAVTRQRNELEAVLTSMVEAVLLVDTEERILRCNRAAGDLLGIAPEKTNGLTIQEVTRNTELQKFVTLAFASEDSLEGDIVFHGTGERFLRTYGTPLLDGEKRRIGALIVLHDVTHLKKLEVIRRDFVANVSHELKTPVTSIKGFVETLKDGAIGDPENAKKFLEIIAKHTDRLNAIIEDLLNLSRIEQEKEKGQIALEESPLEKILRAAIQAYRLRAEEKGIRIEMECSPDLKARINAGLLEHALLNLIDNAVKYSDPETTIHVLAKEENDEVIILVRDEGCGIPREDQERIFERFYRVDRARSRKMGGTGLGLAIVKHVAQAHNGRVHVDSEPGKGSAFFIHLPVE